VMIQVRGLNRARVRFIRVSFLSLPVRADASV